MYNRIRQGVKDVWCFLTDRCPVIPKQDPLLERLREHESAAYQSVDEVNQQVNYLESIYLNAIPQSRERHE